MDLEDYITYGSSSYGENLQVDLNPKHWEPPPHNRRGYARRHLLKKTRAADITAIEKLRWRCCLKVEEAIDTHWKSAVAQIHKTGVGYQISECGQYLTKFSPYRDGVSIGSGDVNLRKDASALEQLAAVVAPTPEQLAAGAAFRAATERVQHHRYFEWHTTAALYAAFVYRDLVGDGKPPIVITVNGRRYPCFGKFNNEWVSTYWPHPNNSQVKLITIPE